MENENPVWIMYYYLPAQDERIEQVYLEQWAEFCDEPVELK